MNNNDLILFQTCECEALNAVCDIITMSRLVKRPPSKISVKPRIYEQIESYVRRKSKDDEEFEMIFDGVEIIKGSVLDRQLISIVSYYGNFQ